MKYVLILLSVCLAGRAAAQQIDNIEVNLYTDSLKRGTFNYINIDGRLSNGRYLPLDSTKLQFEASAGFFQGNSLWLDPGFSEPAVRIRATLRQNPALYREFSIPVKQMADGPLKSLDELMREMDQDRKKKKNSRNAS